MANQPEVGTYDAGVYQIETTDPVQGGVGGVTNAPLLNLANRTGWLKAQLATYAALIANLAPIGSPAFTGTPTAPTPAAGDNSLAVATTGFVQSATNGVSAINCAGSSNVVLTAAQYGASILTLIGALTGNIAIIFPAVSGRWVIQNKTTGAYSVTCKTASGAGVVATQGLVLPIFGDGSSIYAGFSDLAGASLFSAIAPAPNGASSAGVAATAARSDHSHPTDLSGFAESFAEPGYVKLPNGLIWQWMYASVSGNATYSWPVTFPTSALGVMGAFSGSSPPVSGAIAAAPAGNTGVTITCSASSPPSFGVIAIGWGH